MAFIDTDWPVDGLYRDREVDATFPLGAAGFEAVPAATRGNLLELSELEATDRVER